VNQGQVKQTSSAVDLFERLKDAKKILITNKQLIDKKDKHTYPIKCAPFKIPRDWIWCYLSDISIIQEGPGIRKHQYQEEGVQFLTVTNILEGSVDLEKSRKFISKEEYESKYSHFTIKQDDIVTACSGGSWGKSAIFEEDELVILNTSTLRLRFFNDLASNSYLYYLTKTQFFKTSLSLHSTGQQPNFGYYHYSRIPVPLPSYQKQKQIVAILDEAFEKIERAKELAAKNLQNARELFESYLGKIFSQHCEGWTQTTVGEQFTLQRGIDITKSQQEPGTVPVVSSGGIKSYHDTALVSAPGVVIGRKGTLGKVYFLEVDFWPHDTTLWVKDFGDNHPKLVFYFLMSLDVIKLDSGAANPALNRKNVHSIKTSWPEPKIQKTIIKQLDLLSDQSKQLKTIYLQKITDLDELKQSLLQKAFAGELT